MTKQAKVWRNALFVIGVLFVAGAFLISDNVSPKTQAKDQAQAEAFFKFNILTHENMALGSVVPTFKSRDEVWSAGVSEQMNRFLAGSPFVSKMPSQPFVFAYKLEYPARNTAWILWYDDGSTGPRVGEDVTVVIPIDDPTNDMMLSERILQGTETEALVRGYLVEGGVAKILITKTPVYLYPQP